MRHGFDPFWSGKGGTDLAYSRNQGLGMGLTHFWGLERNLDLPPCCNGSDERVWPPQWNIGMPLASSVNGGGGTDLIPFFNWRRGMGLTSCMRWRPTLGPPMEQEERQAHDPSWSGRGGFFISNLWRGRGIVTLDPSCKRGLGPLL